MWCDYYSNITAKISNVFNNANKNAQLHSCARKRRLEFAAKQNRSPHDKYAKIESAVLPNKIKYAVYIAIVACNSPYFKSLFESK